MDHSNRLELDGLAKQDVLGTSLPTLIVSESKSDNPNTMAKKAEICIPGSNKRKVVNTCIDDYGQEGKFFKYDAYSCVVGLSV